MTNAFYKAMASRAEPGRAPADMGEDFDFDNEEEMRRRLPRPSAICLGTSAS